MPVPCNILCMIVFSAHFTVTHVLEAILLLNCDGDESALPGILLAGLLLLDRRLVQSDR